MKRRYLLGLPLALLVLPGCSKPWVVMSQASPNPLLGQTSFSVLPLDFSNTRVGEKAERDYHGGKDEEAGTSWQDDKRAMSEVFAQALSSNAGDAGISVAAGGQGPFVVVPIVEFVEPGFYAYAVKMNSRVEMVVRIASPDGRVIDEFRIKTTVEAQMLNPSSGGRLRDACEALGALTAEYLEYRVSGD